MLGDKYPALASRYPHIVTPRGIVNMSCSGERWTCQRSERRVSNFAVHWHNHGL